ncbi:MAG: hydrolase [Thermodesulfobacteriota bacterium]
MDLEFLTPARCAFLVVDIQERLMAVIHEQERVAKNAVLLIRAAKALEIPIVPTTQYAKGIGPLVPPVAAELRDLTVTDKTEFGCFNNVAVRQRVGGLPAGIDTLILTGVESHICVYQTALGARQAGYRVWVIADAVSSRTPESHRLGLERMASLGVVIGSTEMLIYELLRQAGTPQFKALLPFLK